VVPLLKADTRGELKAGTVVGELRQRHPGQFDDSLLRTLQRRMRDWRAVSGPEREVLFPQGHEPGREGASDFTHCTELGVRVGGVVLVHLLFVFRLSFSGWTWVQIAFGETYEALVEGLQCALWALGGAHGRAAGLPGRDVSRARGETCYAKAMRRFPLATFVALLVSCGAGQPAPERPSAPVAAGSSSAPAAQTLEAGDLFEVLLRLGEGDADAMAPGSRVLHHGETDTEQPLTPSTLSWLPSVQPVLVGPGDEPGDDVTPCECAPDALTCSILQPGGRTLVRFVVLDGRPRVELVETEDP
jgi:hypothetical protein